MDFFISFPVSGVKTWIFLPPLVAFVVSFFASMGGVSGAFLLLPFQLSCLNFVSPSVSSTNFVYNIVAIPSGVYRYFSEGRMVWSLAWIIVLGTLPGVLLGYYIRVTYLPDPGAFKLFVGCVLLWVGMRLAKEVYRSRHTTGTAREAKTNGQAGAIPNSAVTGIRYSGTRIEYAFCEEKFSFEVYRMVVLAFIVGVIGGAYGIGGGSIIAPLCVGFFGLPVYTVAGAALLATFVTSIAGVLFYTLIPATGGISTAPDWPLGILFGLGGVVGMYCGARLQKYVPQIAIKIMLSLILIFLALSYIL